MVNGVVKLAIDSYDQLSQHGARAMLRLYRGCRLLTPKRQPAADVVLMIVGVVTEETLTRVADVEMASTNPHMRIVLIADVVDEKYVVRLVAHGVVSILCRRHVGARDIIRAVENSRSGRADLPDTMVRALIERVRSMHQDDDANSRLGLTVREIHVVRLLADGLSTAEIASNLNYSERTIKNILRNMMARLGLRNRAHVVAHAMRHGVLTDGRRVS